MRVIAQIRRVVQSKWFLAVPMLGAVIVTLLQENYWDVRFGLVPASDVAIIGMIAFAYYIAFLLVVSDNTAVTLLPFLLLCTFVLSEYNSYDRFVRYWWAAIPVLFALLFHFIVYREHSHKSILVYGILAVAVAVTLGGAFSISLKNYFNLVNLYYVAGLGFVMVLLHLFLSAKYHDREGFRIQEYLTLCFFLMGLFACFFLLYHHLPHLWEIRGRLSEMPWWEFHLNTEIQMGNNISTLLLIAMPFAFMMSSKRIWLLPSTAVMLAVLILSGSRAGVLCGGIAFLACTVVFFIIDRRHRGWYLLIPAIGVGTVAALACFCFDQVKAILANFDFRFDLETLKGETRFQMLTDAWREFKSNPLFGSGLGETTRQDIYNPVKFAMNWYHCAPVQIFASLGILGICAYCFEWFTRLRVFWNRRSFFGWTVLLSQLGLFVMSAVNPGFFCPFPYEFLMVMLFAVLSRQQEAPRCPKNPKKQS